MANAFVFADWLSMNALRVLKNKLVIAQMFNKDYIPDYKKDFAVGETVRIPLPQRWVVTTGLAYQEQAINEQYTTTTIDQVKGVHFQWDSFEEALKMQRDNARLTRDFVDAPMTQIAQELDSRAALWATQNTNNIVGVLGTTPTSLATFNSARVRLVENACPAGAASKRMIISPTMQSGIATAVSTFFNPQRVVSNVFNDGALTGEAYGFGDWYESMSLKSTTADTWAGTVETDGANQSGSSLLLTCTNGDTFTKGTIFNIEGVYNVNPSTRESTGVLKQFVITQDTVGASSAATINYSPAIVGPGATPTDGQYQNVSALPANDADLTMYPGTSSPNGKAGINGLAIDRNAFAMVGVTLAAPENGGGIISGQKRDPQTGLTVRFVRAWDNIQSRWTNRYDVAFGFGNLYPDQCAVRVLGLS